MKLAPYRCGDRLSKANLASCLLLHVSDGLIESGTGCFPEQAGHVQLRDHALPDNPWRDHALPDNPWMEERMVVFKTALEDDEWEKLVDHYDETDMCLGLGRKRETEKIRRAFTHSYRYVTAWEEDTIIGAARMISDGECYGWIHDMSVRAAYRKQGIGRQIIERLLEGNESLLVGLTSSFEAVGFYTKLGFKKHKTAMAKYPVHSDYLIE